MDKIYAMAENAKTDSARPSLERLKALDSLPDIASQLQEAKRLCDHSARADMICKWLLERLKSKTELRDTPEAWETLLSALRLLSPQRVAILLSSHGFLGLCKTTLEDEASAAKDALFLVLVRVLNYLIEVSAGPQGTQLKAVLCVPASQAASFLNAWVQSALTLLGIALLEHGLGNDFLRPGIEIWNLRKRAVDENDIFARHCLLSTSRLLPILNHYEHPRRQKRKREAEGSSQHSYKQILESMLARHVFVPARTAFFKARDATETKASRQLGSQDPTFVLRSMFEPLREAESGDSGLDDGQLAVLPQLLDVAIRCTPMATPKQRMKEKPWIDAVFQALLECSGGPDSGAEIRQALRDMLSLTKERQAPLSNAVLDVVVENYSGLGSGKAVDWSLISLVVEINSDVFSSEDKTAVLFAEITRVAGDPDETELSGSKPWESPVQAIDTKEGFLDFLRTRIITPVMRTFADERKLTTFVDMWAAQIKSDNKDNIPLVWTGLEADFAPLLEDSLSQSQILGIFDHYCASIRSVGHDSTSEDERPLQSTLRASIVLLDAMYSGIRSDTLTDALYDRSGELLKWTLGPPSFDSPNSSPKAWLKPFPLHLEPQTWTLMSKMFELWFPAWTMAQPDAMAVAVRGTEIVQSSAFDIATRKLSTSGANTTSAAHAFVASLCSHLLPYDQYDEIGLPGWPMPRKFCLEAISFLAHLTRGSEERNVFLQFPHLVPELLLAEERSSTVPIQSLFPHSPRESSSTVEAASQIESAQALSTIILQRGTAVQVDEFVELLSKRILHQRLSDDGMMNIEELDYKVDEWNETRTLKVLSGLSPESLSRPHREKLIDAICQHQQTDKAWMWRTAEYAQEWRFAVLVNFMKLPNATSKIAVDRDELWRLTRSFRPGFDDKFLRYLEELISLLASHLLATQDQDRSRSMLINLSHGIKEQIEFICVQSKLITCDKTLVVVNKLIGQLENGSKENLKLQYVHREPDLIKRLLEMCLNWLPSRIPQKLERWSMDNLRPGLTMLLAIPESLVTLSGTDTDSWHGPLSQLLQSRMDLLDGNTNHAVHEADGSQISHVQDILVECFQLLCKLSKTDDTSRLSRLAPEIARLRLTASTRDAFMASFRLYVEKLHQSQYIELLSGLLEALHDKSRTTSASVLPLLEVCVTRPSQNDAESDGSQHLRLLSNLLGMITDTQDVLAQKKAIGCVATALKGSSSLVSQYGIELTLQTLNKVLDSSPMVPVVYLDVCQVLSTILLQYRSRLHGRFHLVVQVFQTLLNRLFLPANPGKATDNQGRRKPTAKHAQAFSKLLTLLCEPPQYKRSSKSSSLVDESRNEQAYVGKSVQYILHLYCSRILTGKLGPGMRDAITPGLWSMIEAMEMGEAEGIKTLSAAMNNSERAVLRGVYDDWRRFGKWRGA